MEANKIQIGGRHYKTDYEHWDLAIKLSMDYLVGSTTKYVSRWRKKNGIEDLRKALHYLDKLIEVGVCVGQRRLTDSEIEIEVINFAIANNLGFDEERYIFALSSYTSIADLQEAKVCLKELMEEELHRVPRRREEPNTPGTPDDGGHHA